MHLRSERKQKNWWIRDNQQQRNTKNTTKTVKEGYLHLRKSLVGVKNSLLARRRGDDGRSRLLLEDILGFEREKGKIFTLLGNVLLSFLYFGYLWLVRFLLCVFNWNLAIAWSLVLLETSLMHFSMFCSLVLPYMISLS